MKAVRGAWRLLRCGAHGVAGIALVLLRFPALAPAARRERIRVWAAGMLRAMGIRLEVEGRFRPGAKLVVANHVSWLDIVAVHAVCPEARFVAKAELRHWPLVSRLVDAAQTLYLERERKRDALRVVHQTAEALSAGDTVALFPEGTTGDGHALLPFHANLLQAAIATQTPVQPVALRFSEPGHAVSLAAQWPQGLSFAGSLWKIAQARGLVVRLQVLPAQATAHADRRVLAQHLRDLIAQALA